MKQFCCGDVIPGCTAAFQRPTEDELLQDIAVHAKKDHGLSEIPVPIIHLVRSRITDVSAA